MKNEAGKEKLRKSFHFLFKTIFKGRCKCLVSFALSPPSFFRHVYTHLCTCIPHIYLMLTLISTLRANPLLCEQTQQPTAPSKASNIATPHHRISSWLLHRGTTHLHRYRRVGSLGNLSLGVGSAGRLAVGVGRHSATRSVRRGYRVHPRTARVSHHIPLGYHHTPPGYHRKPPSHRPSYRAYPPHHPHRVRRRLLPIRHLPARIRRLWGSER